MSREIIEKYQVVFYFISIVLGIVLSNFVLDVKIFEKLIWVFLGILLFATFTQIPLTNLYEVLSNRKFIFVASIVNFVVVPIFVWLLVNFLPNELWIKLGVLLVLLVPCTDWFITFSYLGKGDGRIAISFTPISLVLQIFLLPVYVFLFLGERVVISFSTEEVMKAFLFIILIPLVLAVLVEKFLNGLTNGKLTRYFSLLPVPMLSVVIFIITLTQANVVISNFNSMIVLVPIFLGFLVFALVISKVFSNIFKMKVEEGRVLTFSVGTRNSFLVLPIALALHEPLNLSSVVIVFQSLVELVGMIFFIWFVPNFLFKE